MGGVREETTKRYFPWALDVLNYPVPTYFTLTTGRSGTQWLANILQRVEGFAVYHEPVPGLMAWGAKALSGKEVPWEVIRVAREVLVRAAHNHGQAYVEVSPYLSPLADQIKRAFSWAKFIHLWRDPRDYVSSALSRKWYLADSSKSHWWPTSFHNEPWKRAIEHWGNTHRAALEAEKNHDVFRVSASEMWADPFTLCELLEWMGYEPIGHSHMWATFSEAAERVVDAGAQEKSVKWDSEWDRFLYDEAGDVLSELQRVAIL